MKKGTRQLISPNQWLCSILEALYMYHGKMDSPLMPFSIARSAIFRHGRATCMYYSELEDFHMCSIRKIDEANMKVSRVAAFLFEENDQRGSHDVCRCISTFSPAKDDNPNAHKGAQNAAIAAPVQDVSIAYFSNSDELCQYIKNTSFSGVVQHVSADCGPELCETRYRMLKTSWYRQTISTEMKINKHKASSDTPVHEKFCTFDGPMHMVETYQTCSKSLNSKISTFIKTIKNAVNAFVPLSSEIWNGEFYLNHSRDGILRFEFTSFVQIVSKQHFSSLETVDQLIPRSLSVKSASQGKLSRPQTALISSKIEKTSASPDSHKLDSTRAQSASSATNLTTLKSSSSNTSKLWSNLQHAVTVTSPRETLDATIDCALQTNDTSPTRDAFAKLREAQRKRSLHSRFAMRLSSLKQSDQVQIIKEQASVEKLFQVKFKNVKAIAPRQHIDCPQCGVQAELDRCDSIPVDILLNALQVRAKIHALENPNLQINEGYKPLWDIDQNIARLYSCVALFDETLAEVINVSVSVSRAKTISLSEWLAFCRKSKMYDRLPITKNEVVQIFEDANRCDFLSDDNQYEMTIEEFCQALIFVAQKTGYLHHIDRLNAPLSWKLFPDGDVVHCVRSMLDHLDIRNNPEFILFSFDQEGPTSYILQKLKQRDVQKKIWIPTNEIPLQEKIRRENFLAKISEVASFANSKSDGKQSASYCTRAKLKTIDFVDRFADMIVTLFCVHYATSFEKESKEARAVELLLECKEFMSCELRVCESCILQILGVFVSDNSTGMSLQQKAERSFSSRSPSRSPSVASPAAFPKDSVAPTGRGESLVPLLNLSPSALRRCAALHDRGNTGSLHMPGVFSRQEESVANHSSYPVTQVGAFSNPFDLRARRERLLESLLQNEEDSNCARSECSL